MTFTGDYQNSSENGAQAIMSFAGGGDITITGSLKDSQAGFSSTLSKPAGSTGTLSVLGAASTYIGLTSLTAGTTVINDFGAFNNTLGLVANADHRVNFTNGTVDYRGAAVTGAGQTVGNQKILLLNATNSILLGNQTGSATSALTIASNVGAQLLATRNLVLGGSFVAGSDSSVNDIAGVITNNGAATNVTKIGSGTWQFDLANASYGTANASLAITSGQTSSTITGTNTTGLVVGQPVSGTGIPVGTIITDIQSATSFIMNQTPTATGATVNVGLVSGATAPITVLSNAANVLTVGAGLTANLVPGQMISGAGLSASANWYISAINSATTFTVANTTGAAALATNAANGTQTPIASPSFAGNLPLGAGPCC